MNQGSTKPALFGLVAFASVAILIALLTQVRASKKRSSVTKEENKNSNFKPVDSVTNGDGSEKRKIIVLYGTTTGTAKKFANTLYHHIEKKCSENAIISIEDLSKYNYEEQLCKEDIVLIVTSTWEDGTAPPAIQGFKSWLEEQAYDFRLNKDYLGKLQFAVFGLGSAVYGKNYGKMATDLDDMLDRLGATRLEAVKKGDDATTMEQVFYKWNSSIVKKIHDLLPVSETAPVKKPEIKSIKPKEVPKPVEKSSHQCNSSKPSSECCQNGKEGEHEGGGCCQSNHQMDDPTAGLLDEESDTDEMDEEDLLNNRFVEADGEEGVLDLEEIGSALAANKASKQAEALEIARDGPREMVTKLQRKALIKEGYKIIGSHSAVKICRWTKNQLRGRGGCYKHSFYGITSYQCMEATPSLACANKCVFCWRHHKNPVGTEWRWKEDDPKQIVEEAIRLHVSMINEMKGVPGVQTSRLQEAYTVRHCALSLVGEPIMYPHINDVLKELHNRQISSFLVTNAQFPDRIEHLHPVTQLYVSVDASTRDSLKAIDRPLFKDFWERFLASLKALQKKRQRTVYRMTLVKSYNMEEVEGYVQLIEEGLPDFIEIKAVTYCGKSDASNLTMQNVPWHEEVCNYGEQICERIQQRNRIPVKYSIATEHQHSCCILIAREDKFKKNDDWYTWIDYPAFHKLIQEFYMNGIEFCSEDYMAKTPSWAVYKSKERGFDPEEQRWRRNKATGEKEAIPYVATESGCG